MIHPDALGIARRLPTVNHRGGVVRVGEEIREVRGELQRWSGLQRELRHQGRKLSRFGGVAPTSGAAQRGG